MKLASGKAIHSTFEANNKHKMAKKEDMSLDDMVDLAAQSHDIEMADVEDETPTVIGKDKDASLSITRHYRRAHAPPIQPIAVEYGFSIDIPEDDLAIEYRPVIGWVDVYQEIVDPRPGPTQGQRIIALEDYKKVSKRKSQLEIDLAPQLTLYDYAYNLQTEGEVTDVIGFRQLGFNGPRAQQPGPYAEPVYRSPAMMTPEKRRNRWLRVMNQIKQAQRAISKQVFIATDDPRVCSWCDYKPICQEKVEE
jgi:hypothetical protein